MTKTVHTICGTATMAFAIAAAPQGFLVHNINVLPEIAIITAVIGSVVPDYDLKPMHYSQGKKGTAKKIAKAKTKVVNGITGGHRGITHTLLFPVLLLVLMTMIDQFIHFIPFLATIIQSLLFGFSAGWFLHIFADLFNGKGVPLFWPISKKKVHIADFPSEGFGQWFWLLLYLIVTFMIILGRTFI